MNRALRGFPMFLALALVGSAACGDDDGTDTTDDLPVADMGPMPTGDGGPPTDGGPDPLADAFVPGCESLACENGTCSTESGAPVCVCEPGWGGDACDTLDAPAAADTVLWLDATVTDSFTFEGDTVVRWDDLSPSEADFVSESAGTRPRLGDGINARPAITFDGVDDHLVAEGFSGFADELSYTFFIVLSNLADNNILSGYESDTLRMQLADSDSQFGLAYSHIGGGSSSVFSTLQSYERAAVQIITVQRTPEEMSMWVDGGYRVVLATGDSEALPNPIDLVLGHDADSAGTSALSGRMGEVIAFDTALDLASRRDIEAYLAEKWLGEPATHDATSLGNTTFWLDASDDATVVETDGAVAQWISRVGVGRDFTQTAAARRPVRVADGLGGLPVIRFDGDDDKLDDQDSDILNAPYYTLAIVGVRSGDGTGAFFTGTGASYQRGSQLWSTEGGSELFFAHTWPVDPVPQGTTVTGGTGGEPFVAIATWDGAEVTLLTSFGSSSSDNTEMQITEADFVLGGVRHDAVDTDNLEGDIAELLIFARALTDAEQARLLEVLETKWGLAD